MGEGEDERSNYMLQGKEPSSLHGLSAKEGRSAAGGGPEEELLEPESLVNPPQLHLHPLSPLPALRRLPPPLQVSKLLRLIIITTSFDSTSISLHGVATLQGGIFGEFFYVQITCTKSIY